MGDCPEVDKNTGRTRRSAPKKQPLIQAEHRGSPLPEISVPNRPSIWITERKAAIIAAFMEKPERNFKGGIPRRLHSNIFDEPRRKTE